MSIDGFGMARFTILLSLKVSSSVYAKKVTRFAVVGLPGQSWDDRTIGTSEVLTALDECQVTWELSLQMV